MYPENLKNTSGMEESKYCSDYKKMYPKNVQYWMYPKYVEKYRRYGKEQALFPFLKIVP